MGQLDGRVAIVTGGGDGIGAAIARRYASEGASVLIAELNPETGNAIARELGKAGHFVQTNASVKSEVEAMVAEAVHRFGTLDILVNNAWGGGRLDRLERKTEEAMKHGIENVAEIFQIYSNSQNKHYPQHRTWIVQIVHK